MSTQAPSYATFRTGLTFKDVARDVWQEVRAHNWRFDAGDVDTRRFMTRHTVLGRWHQIKRDMYAEFCASFDA